MQIGSPMAASYILGLPDDYTSHRFKPCHWKPFMKEVLSCWPDSDEIEIGNGKQDKVIVRKVEGEYVAFNMVTNYTERPSSLSHMCLYDWFRLMKRYY
ncbi:hypothetical protein K439DRAFT_1349964 [Ramaria rubella]|nr:hypothetical protein K439DRAFT_1349964 [Ramaria rubella]